jgi:hypothetical protein
MIADLLQLFVLGGMSRQLNINAYAAFSAGSWQFLQQAG